MTEAETSRPFLEENHAHELKCYPDPFTAILDGRKTCELRRDDRGYMVGHRLLLREFDPETGYSGRWIFVTVEHIIKARDWPGMEGDYVAMSIKPGRFEGEPPFDQMPARQDEFRLSIAEALGCTHPNMKMPYVMSDRDLLKAIRALRANGAEDARRLQELVEKLRGEAITEQEAWRGKRDRFRKEVVDALGLIDPDDAMILLWIAGIRADGAEDDRQLTLARAERDLAQAEHARIQARWERDNEHHLSMMRRVREFLTEDKL